MRFSNNIFSFYSIEQNSRTFSSISIFIIIASVALAYFLRDFLIPLVLAIFFAYGLNPIVEKLQKKLPSALAVTIPLVASISIITLLSLLFYSNIETLIKEKLPFYEKRFVDLWQDMQNLFNLNQQNYFSELTAPLKDFIGYGKEYILSLFTKTTSLFTDLVLFVLYLCFFLAGIKNFKIKTSRALHPAKAANINNINNRIVTQIQSYILYKTLVTSSVALILYVVFLIYGLDFALVFAFLVFILNFIPIIGPFLASILPIILSFIQFDNSSLAISLTAIIIIVQIVFSNVVEPRIFGKSLSLSSFVVFVSLIFWSFIWGIAGAFLSTPIMASIIIICDNVPSLRYINRFLQSAFPLQEDWEKLSLIYHIVNADSKISYNEQAIINFELKKDIYDPKLGARLWKDVKKHPVSLTQIFNNKFEEDRVKLYALASKIARIDGISDKEAKLIKKIELINSFHKNTIANVNSLAELNASLQNTNNQKPKSIPNKNSKIKNHSNNYNFDDSFDHLILGKEREVAYSYKLLAKNLFQAHRKKEARYNYLKALHLYLMLEDRNNVFECNKYLAILDAYNDNS